YGNGVEQDYQQALQWYQKGAEQDNELAQFNLAQMYDKGLGVRQSKSTAKIWYSKSCDNGNQDGCKRVLELKDISEQ
ncbi:sel1 repeat family protein, partial [Providencia stuartii]